MRSRIWRFLLTDHSTHYVSLPRPIDGLAFSVGAMVGWGLSILAFGRQSGWDFPIAVTGAIGALGFSCFKLRLPPLIYVPPEEGF